MCLYIKKLQRGYRKKETFQRLTNCLCCFSVMYRASQRDCVETYKSVVIKIRKMEGFVNDEIYIHTYYNKSFKSFTMSANNNHHETVVEDTSSDSLGLSQKVVKI